VTAKLSAERVGRITGSRVGAVLGLDRYKGPADVLREMVREAHGAEPEFKGSDATEWGQANEETARADFERESGWLVLDAQEFVIHPEHEFLGISPDGLLGDAGLIEIKCPYRARYTSITEKPEYEAQVQLQLHCTQREWCEFVIWRVGEPLIRERVYVDEFWLVRNLDTLLAFHEDYQRIVRDPELAAPFLAPKAGTVERVDAEWAALSAQFLDLDQRIAALTAERDQIREALIGLAGERSAKGCGVQVIRSERKGSVDYAKLVKDAGLDAEPYRKDGTVVWTVKPA
jgi:putative phage-type endonuclease